MATYEIINPSDPYTLKADDLGAAAAVLLLLGGGTFALEDEEGEIVVPFLAMIDNASGWFLEVGITDINQWFRVEENRSSMADVLDTVLIGKIEDRAHLDEKIAKMAPKNARSFLRKRHEKHRSSMNDIGRAARQLAARLRGPLLRGPLH